MNTAAVAFSISLAQTHQLVLIESHLEILCYLGLAYALEAASSVS
jgi:hypothetical protein